MLQLESCNAEGVRILHIQNVDYSHSGEVLLSVTHRGRKAPSVRAYSSLLVLPQPRTDAVPSTYTTSAQDSFEEFIKVHSEDQLVPARILEGPSDCSALIGGSIGLTVRYKGHPKPDVKWLKASRPISEQPNISISTGSNRSTLLITDIAADDSGKYTVEVMNKLNESAEIAVASVAVEGPPDAPSGKPSLSLGADRVAVAWCGPPYDGGCILTGFIIEMQQATHDISDDNDDNNGDWHAIATVTDSLAYTVKNLEPGRVYRFRVRAVNMHGESDPGMVSDCVELKAAEVLPEDFQKPIRIEPGGDFRSRFLVLEELGKGRFGVVFKVQEKANSRQILAAKVIKCIKARDKEKVHEEISIMRSLQHPKLLQLAAVFENAREIVMVMEYITGGELFERVVADDFTLTERDCILFVRQVCEGVAYMHSQSIVHLDLKPENIMCRTRSSHQIKIIDFGLAQRLKANCPMRVLFGTPEFIPPEVISYEPIGFQSDMWSVGVICYVLLSGLSPFMGDTDAETFANITRADFDFEDEAFDCVSQGAKDFISNLLVHRKENRWTAVQCLESEWLTQALDEHLNNNRICTDKLKKFIIRRKWQKTGNAIRALGRMATLSASRRNSAASTAGSLPSSPRPSITAINTLGPPTAAVHMSSLHEEEDDFNVELPKIDLNKIHKRNTLRERGKSECKERSDSGFSECSNCSGTGNSTAFCTHVAASMKASLPLAIPKLVLKSDFEQIPKMNEENSNDSKATPDDDERPPVTHKTHKNNDQQQVYGEGEGYVVSATATTTDHAHEPRETHEAAAASTSNFCVSPSPTRQSLSPKSTIMRSDFTNTIQMRKKSLENNLSREKVKQPKTLLEQSGKVSRLKNKFNHSANSSAMINDDGVDPTARKTVFNRLACNKKTAAESRNFSKPSSPLSVRSITPNRLNGRVKEATERLSQQQTVASANRTEARKATATRRTQTQPS